MILKSGKHICRVSILSNFVAKLGQTWGSLIMVIKSLQSVPKLWHVECWSILSIAYRSASTSKCKVDSRRGKFHVSTSWTFSKLFIQIHLHPLNWVVNVHDASIMHILPELKFFMSIVIKYILFFLNFTKYLLNIFDIAYLVILVFLSTHSYAISYAVNKKWISFYKYLSLLLEREFLSHPIVF